MRNRYHTRAPDGGWGWVVVVAAVWLVSVNSGTWWAFALLYVKFSEVFDQSKAVVGLIGSLNVATSNMLGVVSGPLVNRYGCRPICFLGLSIGAFGFFLSAFVNSVPALCITYGLIAGSGVGIMQLPSVVVVQQYFDQRRGLAGGIASLGFPLGNIYFPLVTSLLLDYYGWRGTLLLTSAMILQTAVPAALLWPLPSHKLSRNLMSNKTSKTTSGSRCSRSVLCEPVFLLYASGTFLMNFGLSTFGHHTPSRAVFHGLDPKQVAVLPLLFGVADFISRAGFSFIANLSWVNRPLMYGVGICMAGVVVLVSSFFTGLHGLMILFVVCGIFTACYYSVQTTALADLLGVDQIAQSKGFLLFAVGSAKLISIPLAGLIFDLSHNYDLPIFITGIMEILGGFVVLLILCVRSHKPRTAQLGDVIELCDSESEAGRELLSSSDESFDAAL